MNRSPSRSLRSTDTPPDHLKITFRIVDERRRKLAELSAAVSADGGSTRAGNSVCSLPQPKSDLIRLRPFHPQAPLPTDPLLTY